MALSQRRIVRLPPLAPWSEYELLREIRGGVVTTPHEGRRGSFCSEDPLVDAASALPGGGAGSGAGSGSGSGSGVGVIASPPTVGTDGGTSEPAITRRGSFSALEASAPGANSMAWVQIAHVRRHIQGRGWLQPFVIPKAGVTILPFQVLTPVGEAARCSPLCRCAISAPPHAPLHLVPCGPVFVQSWRWWPPCPPSLTATMPSSCCRRGPSPPWLVMEVPPVPPPCRHTGVEPVLPWPPLCLQPPLLPQPRLQPPPRPPRQHLLGSPRRNSSLTLTPAPRSPLTPPPRVALGSLASPCKPSLPGPGPSYLALQSLFPQSPLCVPN